MPICQLVKKENVDCSDDNYGISKQSCSFLEQLSQIVDQSAVTQTKKEYVPDLELEGNMLTGAIIFTIIAMTLIAIFYQCFKVKAKKEEPEQDFDAINGQTKSKSGITLPNQFPQKSSSPRKKKEKVEIQQRDRKDSTQTVDS